MAVLGAVPGEDFREEEESEATVLGHRPIVW